MVTCIDRDRVCEQAYGAHEVPESHFLAFDTTIKHSILLL